MQQLNGLPAIQQAVAFNEDFNLPRKIHALLAELADRLGQANPQEPIVKCLIVWHQKFKEGLRHPDTQLVINRFIGELERLFKNPADENAPLNPDLFGTSPLPIVQFVIGKMIDPQSLFYSRLFFEASQQVPRPPAAAPAPIPDDIEAMLRLIDGIQAERDREEEQRMEERRRMQERHLQLAERHQQGLEEINRYAQERFQQIQAGMQEMREENLRDRERLQGVVHHLREEAQQLRQEVQILADRIAADHRQLNLARAEADQLQIAINETREAIREQQSNWIEGVLKSVALVAVSVCVTWGVSSMFSGLTLQGTNHSLTAGVFVNF